MGKEIRIKNCVTVVALAIFSFILPVFGNPAAGAENESGKIFKVSDRDTTGDLEKAASGRLKRQSELLEKEIRRLEEVRENGGWARIDAKKKYYQHHQKDPAVKQIKARLRASGDFTSNDTSSLFTDDLVVAIKKVQRRFGFKENGVVDAQLVKELNTPVAKRIEQLRVNLERTRLAPPSAAGIELVANIPEFKLYVYDGDQVRLSMDIVVGTESNRTVIFNDEMTHIVFSPYWNVPPSIVRNEILPEMRKSSSYLRRNGYEQTGTENGLPVIRQRPGAKNSLGRVKFFFPNSHAIYFHDTPARSLFQLRKRTFSHGCIRLSEPARLAEFLLKNAPGWTPSRIEKAMESGKEQWVLLPEPVPVAITYFTAWVDDEGLLHFREDVYGHDKEVARSLASSKR